MKKLIILSVLAFTGCSAAQVTQLQTDQAAIQTGIATACTAVQAAAAIAAPLNAVDPKLASLGLFATASCGGANAIAALTTTAVNDPTTVAWTQNLATQINAEVTAVKAITP